MAQMEWMATTSGTLQIDFLFKATNKPWGGFARGIKQNMYVTSYRSVVFCMYETAVQLSQMLQRIVACSLNIVEHTLYYDDNIILVGLTFVIQRSWHFGLELPPLALISVF